MCMSKALNFKQWTINDALLGLLVGIGDKESC